MLKPQFVSDGVKCQRVLECPKCLLRMNRDLLGASNICWAARHTFTHVYHPWRLRSAHDTVKLVKTILEEE